MVPTAVGVESSPRPVSIPCSPKARDLSTWPARMTRDSTPSPSGRTVYHSRRVERFKGGRCDGGATRNPLPASPALAASMAAFKARRLVCSEIPLITSRIRPILTVLSLRISIFPHEVCIVAESCPMALIVSETTCRPVSVCRLAEDALEEASPAFYAIS